MNNLRFRALAALIIAALPATAHAWTPDLLNGASAICTAPDYQFDPQVISDGSGGAIIGWWDNRSGTYQVYVQHVNARGVALWSPNGVKLSNTSLKEVGARLVPDGSGGAIVHWITQLAGILGEIRVQRVNAAGQPQWAAGGVVLCSTADNDGYYAVTSDGAGGVVLAWPDFRNGATQDIYAQRVNASGVPQWTLNGQAVCLAANYQYISSTIQPDGAGGFLLCWQDYRSGSSVDLYAQKLSASGAPLWTPNGIVVAATTGDQANPQMVPDGVGGAVFCWDDRRTDFGDIYAQRISAVGVPLWAANGITVGSGTGIQQLPALVSDGLGGGIVAWTDNRAGGVNSDEIYVQHLSASGGALWGANGVLLTSAPGSQSVPCGISDGHGGALFAISDHQGGADGDIYGEHVNSSGSPLSFSGVPVYLGPGDQYPTSMAPDGAGGAIIVWTDKRYDLFGDIYAQRMSPEGLLGSPETGIASVRDVPFDQGGWVRLTFAASYLDVPAYDQVLDSYQIWRSVPTSQVGALVSQRGATSSALEAAASGKLLVGVSGLEGYAWEPVGRVNRNHLPSYSVLIGTTSDSLPGSNPLTLYLLETHTETHGYFSAPDSAYSADNLPPQPPSQFTAQYQGGTTYLDWALNGEADLAGFRLYRGAPSDFVPGPSNLLSSQANTGYVDGSGGPAIYKLAAVDIHGNQSAPTIVVPDGALDVDDAPAARLALEAPAPNPVHAGAEAAIRFSLSRAGESRLAVFDAQGRMVRTLARGHQAAGAHMLRWDGRSESGARLPAALYFLKLDAEGSTLVRRLALLK